MGLACTRFWMRLTFMWDTIDGLLLVRWLLLWVRVSVLRVDRSGILGFA